VELAAHVLHHPGRAREVAKLVGAVETGYLRVPRARGHIQAFILGWAASVNPLVGGTGFDPFASLVDAAFDEDRLAGRSLPRERAADLALRVLDEELALAAPSPGGGSEAAGAPPPATPSSDAGIFRREGDVWAVTWAGRTVRLRAARGFAYLAVLLR